MDYLTRLRSFSYQYEIIRLIFVFVGASIVIMSSQYMAMPILDTFSQFNQEQTDIAILKTQIQNSGGSEELEQKLKEAYQEANIHFATLGLLLLLLFAIPIIISLFLTKVSSEKRIVPPLYMQILVFGYALIYLAFHEKYDQELPIYLFLIGFYSFFAGITQNSIVTWIVGIPSKEPDVIRFSFKTYNNIKTIQNILLSDVFSEQLGLSRKTEKTERGIILRNKPKMKYDTIVELEKGLSENITFINVVIFERTSYDLKRTISLDEYARRKKLYLIDILGRDNNEEKIRFEEISSTHAEPLVLSVLDNVKGVYTHVEGISKMGIFKAIMLITGMATIGGLFLTDRSTEGFTGLLILLMYLSFEIPSKISHQRK